ncbi:DUF5797 family protein [Halobaculum litoreum]|uniref:DUF5797 family protein n=1 Tax=Halobaculum litoreum TaxID=3031998 RepID=UPI0024C3135F|nr:DUF5797 family protein [Halobaculum sp. DT92]
MSDLTDEELERLGDVVRLQPTKNSELGDRWGMDSGSDVHGYLENHLKDYYYRDDNSLIRATSEAAELTGVEPGIVDDGDDPDAVPERLTVPELHAQVFRVVADHDERSESVVSVLNKVREAYGVDPGAGDVRRALQSLRRKNVVEVVYRTVPTFKLAVPREDVEVVAESEA